MSDSEYIIDDSLDELKLGEDIRKMTDEEFEAFQEEFKKTGKYPDKYYLA